MKNQYAGDIGDYGKYGLLRFLIDRGIRVGVNWYLTDNDDTTHGEMTDYLYDPHADGDMRYDRELFSLLKPIAARGKEHKRVEDIEQAGILPGAVFFHEELPSSDAQARPDWHSRAMKALSDEGLDLIFADPDNGTLREQQKLPKRNGRKYALLSELRDYYDAGKNVVYYCHKARRKPSAWNEKKNEFNDETHHARIIVLTFHRGTQRSYIFAIHPEDFDRYDAVIHDFLLGPWGSIPVKKKSIPFIREQ